MKVIIASPSDVSQERRLIRDVVHEWNAIHAEDRQVVLMPVGWESDSFPEMGDRPQAIINRQLLRESDLLVAVFWTRLGSPTGTAPSGTVEEIEEHLAAEKPAMIYFSSAPVRLDSIDNTQYSALKEFKETCRQRGLIEEYDDLSQFRAKFVRQLAQTVIRRFTEEDNESEADEIPKPRQISIISEAARELLLEASRDPNGVIMRLGTLAGTHVLANNREFTEPNVRSAAKWRSAVDELNIQGLIEDRAGKGEVFFITDTGYRVVDYLRTQYGIT